MVEAFLCVACGLRIPEASGYVCTDAGPIHLRCPFPKTRLTRCPTCGREVWELGYLVINGAVWHPRCPNST